MSKANLVEEKNSYQHCGSAWNLSTCVTVTVNEHVNKSHDR